METTTYSFGDLSGAIAHPLLGSYSFQGQGVGSINISPQTEKTTHKRASDGSIMVNKIAGRNAAIDIVVQQTSEFDAWLQNAFNILDAAPADQWALFTATFRNTVTARTSIITGMSFRKEADLPNGAEGQDRTWSMLAAEHTLLTV